MMTERFFLSILCLLLLFQLASAYNYSEGIYGDSFYGTGYYVAPAESGLSVPTVSSVTTSGGSGYAPKIYYSDSNFNLYGNNFNLWFNDKIKFIINFTNHTLTLNQFNSTTVEAKIESSSFIVYLEKGATHELDLNSDLINDVRIRYDGMNNTKALMFIQGINPSVYEDSSKKQKDETSEIQDSNKIFSSILIVIIVLIVIFVLGLVFIKNRLKKRYYTKGI